MSFRVTRGDHIMGFIISLAIMGIMFRPVLDISFILNMSGYSAWNSIIFFFIIIILVSLAHELIHALAFKIFGGNVRMGIKGLYAYTQELSGVSLTRFEFAVVLLSPLTIISIAAALISGWIGGVIYILSITGSTGDLIMAFKLVKYGPCRIVSKLDSFEVIK